MSTTAYDVISYPGWPNPETHPDRLAALGRLFELPTASPDTCRVLELGCGDGGNFIPTAATWPRATFLGLDLSASAIARGQAIIAALGLKNAALRQMDLLEVPADLGTFEYIVAHGVYTWVPAPVRDRILHICHRHLAPQGVAYISFNVLPGCRLRQAAWDLMRYHTASAEPAAKVAQARAILKRAAESATPESTYAAVLQAESQRLTDAFDTLIFHDDLSDLTTPLHFHEFAAHAAAHGMQYLCDADYKQDGDPHAQPRITKFLQKLGETDLIRREQYADFVSGRPFRRSLLCHAATALSRPVTPLRLRGLRLASALAPTKTVNPAAGAIDEFRLPQGKAISLNQPLAKAALLALGEAWPQSLPFEQLLARARHLSRGVDDQQEETLARFLLTTLSAKLVQLHTLAAPLVTQLSRCPRVSPLARWQACQGPMVSTQKGQTIRLDGDPARRLLSLLDGTRDLPTLSRQLGVPQSILLPKLHELARAGMLEA